jgi:hypothetical protein
MAALKPGRQPRANIEWFAAVVMEACGIPRDLFTPTFAVTRVIGWCAQALEQAADNRIIRPNARYIGPSRTVAGARADVTVVRRLAHQNRGLTARSVLVKSFTSDLGGKRAASRNAEDHLPTTG